MIPGLILALFLAGEVGFRLAYFGPAAVWHPIEYSRASAFQRGFVLVDPDPGIGWTLRPGVSSHLRGARFSTNSQGYRGPEMSVEKPPGRVRLIALGSSITMGAGVDDDETYPYQLEAWLHAHGRTDVEVLNAGVANYTTRQMVAAYERDLRDWDADGVLLPVYPGTLGSRRERQPFRRTVDGWDLNARQVFAHFYAFMAIRDRARTALGRWLAMDWSGRAHPATGPGPPRNRVVFSEFARRREAEGKTVFVALLVKARDYGPGRFETTRERVTRWAAQHPNVIVLDGLEGLDDRGFAKDQIFPGDNHPNGAHHARSAATIGAKLLPRLPPPRAATP